MEALRITFIGPSDYQTFLDLNESGLASETLIDTPMRKVIRGNWGGAAVLVLWDDEKRKGTMMQVNGIDAERKLKLRISQGDFSMFEAKEQEA